METSLINGINGYTKSRTSLINGRNDPQLADALKKISPEAQEKLEALVQAGVFRSRAEAAGFLIDEGIKTQSALFDRVRTKLAEIERLRAELRGMIADNKV